jgi:sodium/bile acid cotransporter 7
LTDSSDRPATAVPRTEQEVVAAASACGLVIDPLCLPGVLANLAVLDGHAVTLLGESA